jgi:hypothetical protein
MAFLMARFIDHVVNCCHSWCPPDPRVSCYRDITLARFKLARVSAIPSDMGNTCPLQSFSSNSTLIMLYLVHEMDIDYLVVDEMINTSKLFHYNCMLRIGCKPLMLIT